MTETTTTLERAIERGTIDLESGEFPMVLATQGETADGHILNIRGANIPDTVPLQINHANSPLETLGTVFNIRRGVRNGVPVLRATGKIELEGEGTAAEIRRDVAHMISRGHLNSVSIRAQGDKATPRRALPKNHSAFVAETENSPFKRFGMFFERFTPLEGSIVAIGADKQAVIGRSRETDGEVSQFWSTFPVEEAETEPQDEVDKERTSVSDVTDIRSLERFLRDVGASRNEAKRVISLLKKDGEPQPTQDPPRDVERKVETAEDLVRDAQGLIRSEMKNLKYEIQTECSDILKRALGRV